MQDRPKAIVGLTAIVRAMNAEPAYFTDIHRRYVGTEGVVHAIVPAVPRDNPFVKLKFPPDDRVVFFRLSELDVREPDKPVEHSRHGERSSHLPKR